MSEPTRTETNSGRNSHRSIFRSAAVMTVFTLLSRVLGLVREQVRGYYLGTGMGSDAFGLAASIPNLFRRLLGEGAINSAFVPILSEYREKGDPRKLGDFFSSFLTLFTFVLALVCVLGIALSNWLIHTFFSEGFGEIEGKLALTIVLTQIMFPYLFLVGLAALVQGVLNSFDRFGPSAFTPVLLNLSIIGCAILLHDLFPDPTYAFATGFVVGGLFQLIFQLPWFFGLRLRIRLSFNWAHPGVRTLIRNFGPVALSAGIYQVNVFVSQMIASSLEPGSIASLQYSIRLQELVLGVFVVSMTTVILPALSRQHTSGDKDGFGRMNQFSLNLLALVTLPATAGLLMLRYPIVSLLFEQGEFTTHSTQITAYAVLFHSVGIYFIATSRSLNQAFFAMKDTRTPLVISAISMAVNVIGCYTLTIPLGHGGIALANSLSALVATYVAFLLLHRRGTRVGFLRHCSAVFRIGTSAAGMAAALWLFGQIWPYAQLSKAWLLLYVGVAVVLGLSSFVLFALVLARDELQLLWTAIRR